MAERKSYGSLLKQYGPKLFAVCFWLAGWELLSRFLDNDIVLAPPLAVLVTLFDLVRQTEFWQTILFSSLRIILGFVLALTGGTILAIISFRFRLVEELISPIMKIIKAMPVASFIILALFWINVNNLSVLASFMMVVPMFYSNVIQGIKETDEKLLQMAEVYRLGRLKKLSAIYIPSVAPFFLTAVSVGIGFGWKSGIAAEVIGIPAGSIGRMLYEAKLYVMTKELLAWTVIIIIISVIFEKSVLVLLRLFHRERRN